jgi:hypothetical protein
MTPSEYIQKYLDLGFSLTLITPRQKSGSVGRLYAGQKINLTTDCNIGLILGEPTFDENDDVRVVHALDFDTVPGYEAWAAANPGLANTPTQITPKGYHVLFTLPYQCHNAKSPDLDLISQGWYILVQPSIHPDGSPYTWILNPFFNPFVHVDSLEEIGIDLSKLDFEQDDYDEEDPALDDEDDFYQDPVVAVYRDDGDDDDED